jgi:Cytochrome P450
VVLESAHTLQEDMNIDYLLTQSAVNELTTKFTEVLRNELTEEPPEWKEVKLYGWLKRHMFSASTVAFLGSHIFETYPNLAEDFFVFDAEVLRMFFGLPKFLAPEGFNARDRLLDGLARWVAQGLEEYGRSGREGPDPKPTGWDPVFGSRVVQAREWLWGKIGLSMRGRAGLHLGLLFGLASNAIPATGWMLMHILSPDADSTLLPRVLAEVQSARLEDGTLDIPTLTSLPLLQSIFHETLRMYVDVLVTREIVDSDLILPVDAAGRKQLLLKKNSFVMVPSWLGHRDADAWGGDVFFPERFLRVDEKTGKEIFSTTGTGGKFFPFGGGRNICPGRVFAKQEILASVAMFLLGFDVEVVRFVDEAGKGTAKFPGLRKGFSGNGIMAMDGDFKVRIRRKSKAANE